MKERTARSGTFTWAVGPAARDRDDCGVCNTQHEPTTFCSRSRTQVPTGVF